MIPKEQRVEFYWHSDKNGNSLIKECRKWIDDGYIIHQIIPFNGGQSHHLLLYKY